jgi:hypothetical protein
MSWAFIHLRGLGVEDVAEYQGDPCRCWVKTRARLELLLLPPPLLLVMTWPKTSHFGLHHSSYSSSVVVVPVYTCR